MPASGLRRAIGWLQRTPLHPQWLLGPRRAPAGLRGAGGRVLDVGAADRWLAPWLGPRAHYVALDYPPTGGALYGGRPDVFADGARLPFADGCFDAVACLEVLEHVRDPGQVLAEIRRVLRPGARAYLSMPFLYPVHDAPHDYQRFTAHGWERSAAAAGLELVSVRRTGHALHAAGVAACLALGGALLSRPAWLRWVLLPVAALLVLAVNLGVALLALAWPDWEALSLGHDVELRRP